MGKQTAGLSQKAPLRSAPRVLIQMPPPLSRGPLVRRKIMRNSEVKRISEEAGGGGAGAFQLTSRKIPKGLLVSTSFLQKSFS